MLKVLLYKLIEDDVLFLPPVPDRQQAFELEIFICNYKFFVSQKKNLKTLPLQHKIPALTSFPLLMT